MGEWGSGIKSIQRGIIEIVQLTETATLSPAVVTSKTSLRYLGHQTNNTNDPSARFAHLALTNSTTITATRIASSDTIEISWEIIEYY